MGKHFIFIMRHSQSATLPVHLFVSLFVNLRDLSYYFQRWIFLKVLIWTLRDRWQVVECLNGSRVNSHGQFIFGKQSLSLFRGNTAFQQNRRCNFLHFLDMVETWLFFFFRKSELLTMKNRELNIPFARYEQSTPSGVNS